MGPGPGRVFPLPCCLATEPHGVISVLPTLLFPSAQGALPHPGLSSCCAPRLPPSLPSTPNATTHHIPALQSANAGSTVPQGHRLAVVGLSNWKGNREKMEIKERKELIRILPRPQWLCFRRADTTRLLMPFLRGLRRAVGFWRCSGTVLVRCGCERALELGLVPARPAMSPSIQSLSPAGLCSPRQPSS